MAHGAEGSDPVFRAKLTMPRPRGLQRPRLLGALDGLWHTQLGLVVAPAGSGKTTLAAQYAQARVTATAWVRAERADGDVDRLVRHVGEAVVLGLGLRPSGGGLDGVLAALEAWTGERALIVLDDIHLLDGTPALDAVGRLVSLSPPGVRVLGVGRSEPSGLDLSRLRLGEELCEVTADDLRFRPWEVERLFTEVYRAPLAADTVEQVTRRTGGWAAGLQLLYLAAAGRTAASGRIAGSRPAEMDIADRSRLLGAYLATNVLAELPPALRAFVHRCAPLGLLTPELCDQMLGTTGSRAVLEELERQQICRPVPGGQRVLPLLQAHLDAALRERLGPAIDGEYARAARLLERAGAYVDAMHAYARAGEWEETARLLGGHGEQVAEHRSAVGWDDVLPAALVQGDPWLLLGAARRRYADGQLHRAADLYERAEQAAGEPRARALARAEREEVTAWSAGALVTGSAW